MTVTDAFAESVGQTIQWWSDPERVSQFAAEAGLPSDAHGEALVRVVRKVAMGVAHTLLVTIDNGGPLAGRHLLALVEIDADGRVMPEGELGPGLHERAFDYLPDEFMSD